MTNKIMERFVAILFILFLPIYAVVQITRLVHQPVKTETVYEYNVSRTVEASGIAIREETVLEESVFGVEHYLVDDGARVSVGETVAEFYKTSSGDKSVKRARELQEEIQMLRGAQDPTSSSFGNTELVNRDIKEQLGALSAMASTGQYRGVADMRSKLTSLLNKRQVASGKTTGFDARIAALQTELQGLQTTVTNESATTVVAPKSGYFSKYADGYEAQLTFDIMDSYTVDDYLRLLKTPPPQPPKGRVGKMVYNSNWYFAATAPVERVDWVKPGQVVQLQLDQSSQEVSATVRQVIVEKGNDTAVLLLHCHQLSDELINLRTSNVIIQFQKFTGLRINTADIRFRTNAAGETERGVYILRQNTVYFRLIEPEFEEAGFILSHTYYKSEEFITPQRTARALQQAAAEESVYNLPPEPDKTAAPVPIIDDEDTDDEDTPKIQEENPDYKWYVMLFDQVITEGNDLYHGKTIQ